MKIEREEKFNELQEKLGSTKEEIKYLEEKLARADPSLKQKENFNKNINLFEEKLKILKKDEKNILKDFSFLIHELMLCLSLKQEEEIQKEDIHKKNISENVQKQIKQYQDKLIQLKEKIEDQEVLLNFIIENNEKKNQHNFISEFLKYVKLEFMAEEKDKQDHSINNIGNIVNKIKKLQDEHYHTVNELMELTNKYFLNKKEKEDYEFFKNYKAIAKGKRLTVAEKTEEIKDNLSIIKSFDYLTDIVTEWKKEIKFKDIQKLQQLCNLYKNNKEHHGLFDNPKEEEVVNKLYNEYKEGVIKKTLETKTTLNFIFKNTP